jgi:hypothetical protein
MQAMKRILVILNAPANSIYGASKSFRAHYHLLNDNYYFDALSQLSFGDGELWNKTGAFIILRNALGYTFSFRENIFTSLKFIFGIIYFPILLAKVFKADIIHLNSVTLVLYAPLLNFLSPKTEIICHVREIISRNNYFTNKCLESAHKIICIDEAVKHSLGVNEEKVKVFVIPNPVVVRACDNKFKFDNVNFINIGIVGRLSAEKKTIEILEYFKLKKYQSEKPIMVHIVGGAGADISYYNNCKNIINCLDNVHYLGEIADLENTNFYEQIDCLLRFDDHYSVGRTVLEAIHYGVDIYTEKDISGSVIGANNSLSSRFFSIEKDKNFNFKNKACRRGDSGHHTTTLANEHYVKKFIEEIYV